MYNDSSSQLEGEWQSGRGWIIGTGVELRVGSGKNEGAPTTSWRRAPRRVNPALRPMNSVSDIRSITRIMNNSCPNSNITHNNLS